MLDTHRTCGNDVWSAPSGSNNYTQSVDLVRVDVRAILVYVRVVREERTLRNLIRVRDADASVPGLQDVRRSAVLASDAQTDDLYMAPISLGIHDVVGGGLPRQLGGWHSWRR